MCALAGVVALSASPASAAAPEAPEALTPNPVTATEATLRGTLYPNSMPGVGSTYEFLYKAGAECEGGTRAPEPPGMALSEAQAVSRQVTGLAPGTEYAVCLRVENTESEASVSPPVTFTTPPAPPIIASEFVTGVEATGATLHAEIDAAGAETTYHFEYGTTDSYDQSTPESASIGADDLDHAATAQINDLQPAVTYHYRLVATNSQSPSGIAGPDHIFTTPVPTGSPQGEGCSNEQLRAQQPFALALPDCRAYETVSPLDKNDTDAVEIDNNSVTYASVSGEAITYASFGNFAGSVGGEFHTQYLSRRSTAGWSTMAISPPHTAFETSLESAYHDPHAFTPELTKGIAEADIPLTSEAPAGFYNIYLADFAAGSYQLANTFEQVDEPYRLRNRVQFGGASTDLSHVVSGYSGDRFWDWTGGQASLASVASNGAQLPQPEVNSVSGDGSVIVMTSPEFFDLFSGTPQVYARENPDQPQSPLDGEGNCTVPADACTVEASASQRTGGDPHGPQPARFWGASLDGSKIFFTSAEELTDNANTGPADNAANLYEYDVESNHLTDLTVDTMGGDANGAVVTGVVDVSQDGSYVYFLAEGDLAAGAVAGKSNLYLYHNGAIAFVGTTSVGQVAATPDGRRFAFVSTESLTGYDNQRAAPGECEENGSGGRCDEVYLYDATSASAVCVSCDPTGARPVGGSSLSPYPAGVPFLAFTDHPVVNFSDDGSRLFFQSEDGLVAHDSNGRQDVYEYENGHLYPVSDVAGGNTSYFLDTDATGANAFIATRDQLVPQDTDFRVDVYDARVGGGFPVSPRPSECDNGDSCKGPVSPQPSIFAAPGSATFVGAGNPPPPPSPAGQSKPKSQSAKCKKGRVKKHGKCVKKRRKTKHKRARTGGANRRARS